VGNDDDEDGEKDNTAWPNVYLFGPLVSLSRTKRRTTRENVVRIKR
jgi:hypothetical protein